MKSFLLFFLFAGSLFASQVNAAPTDPVPKRVSFTLHNKSLKSIPLRIPGVMNPNLSPMSDSEVSLAVGQKVLFKYKGKRRVLLVVSEALEGTRVDVVQERKATQKRIANQEKRKRNNS